jgi:WD40 repeat protein
LAHREKDQLIAVSHSQGLSVISGKDLRKEVRVKWDLRKSREDMHIQGDSSDLEVNMSSFISGTSLLVFVGSNGTVNVKDLADPNSIITSLSLGSPCLSLTTV